MEPVRESRFVAVRRFAQVCLGLLLFWSVALHAQSVVLIHGFGADSTSWEKAGVLSELARAGWPYAGALGRRQPARQPSRPPSESNLAYTVNIDSLASIDDQLVQLRHALAGLVRSGRSIVLVGHSAGGILARYYMVRHPRVRIAALVSIASPNLGSTGADLARLAQDSPLGWLGNWMPGRMNPLRLAAQLAPERPGSFLYWLNRQPHPPADYVAIVHRPDRSTGPADALLVTPESQDLRAVYALRGRAISLEIAGSHALGRHDGQILVRLLRRFSTT